MAVNTSPNNNTVTINKIDSLTENYTNPFESKIQNEKLLGKDVRKLETPHGDEDQDVTFENIEEYFMEHTGLKKNDDQRGILDQIVYRLITTGRFKFIKMGENFDTIDRTFIQCRRTPQIAKFQKCCRIIVTCRRLKVVAKQAS